MQQAAGRGMQLNVPAPVECFAFLVVEERKYASTTTARQVLDGDWPV